MTLEPISAFRDKHRPDPVAMAMGAALAARLMPGALTENDLAMALAVAFQAGIDLSQEALAATLEEEPF